MYRYNYHNPVDGINYEMHLNKQFHKYGEDWAQFKDLEYKLAADPTTRIAPVGASLWKMMRIAFLKLSTSLAALLTHKSHTSTQH